MGSKVSRFAPVALAGGLVGWSATAGLAVAGRHHPLVRGAVAAGLVWLTRARLGLRPPALWAGIRVGLPAATAAAAAVAAGTALPPVRAGMAGRGLPRRAVTWLLVGIPVGTVWSEEAAYRAALGTVAAGAFGRPAGRLLQASAFGLSHIYDARAAGQPVAATVLATGVAGWVFARLFERSGSLAAPMLAHMALNEAGALAALAVRRRGG